MRVITKSRLLAFAELPGRGNAMDHLLAWYRTVEDADWKSWGNLKQTYASASLVGDCVVFNIAGNKYRLVTRVRYKTHKVFVLKVLTHAEYDENKWPHECGCHTPPPKGPHGKRLQAPAAHPRRQPKRPGRHR